MERTVLVVSIIIAMFGWLHAQQAPAGDPPPVTITPLNDHLYIVTVTGGREFNLPLYGTNLVASVGNDGILLVDAGFASTAEALRDTLKTLGNGQVVTIITTHSHGDHAMGNRFFKDGARIIAPQSVIEQMSGRYFSLPGTPSPNQPTEGFNDSMVMRFNGEEIRITQATGGHTRHDAIVYFPASKLVAAGDLFFPDAIPYVDLGSGGTVAGYARQVKDLIADYPDDVTFLASHGRAYSKDDLRGYDRMLTETIGLISEAVARGETLEQILDRNLLAKWASWAGQFPTTTLEAWTQTIYVEAADLVSSKPSICEPLTKTLVNGTGADAVTEYRALKASQPEAFDYDEGHLNMLGYQLLMRERIDDALAIFALNAELFPGSFNVYDSYGEALMMKGDTVQSIANYEKSLELNPENTNATEMLQRLRGEK